MSLKNSFQDKNYKKILFSILIYCHFLQYRIFLSNKMCFFYLVFIAVLKLSICNLVCNGDFESYPLTSYFNGDYYIQMNSDVNCWYNKDGGKVRIKKKSFTSTTKAAELNVDYSYTLCQKINLITGRQYQLEYSLFCPSQLYNMQLTVSINNAAISTLYAQYQQSFKQKSLNITATNTINQICFEETHSANHFYLYKYRTGGFVDNISLIEINVPQPPPPPVINSTNTTNTNQTNTNNISSNNLTNNNSNQTATNNQTQTITPNQTTTANETQTTTTTNQTTAVNQTQNTTTPNQAATVNQTQTNINQTTTTPNQTAIDAQTQETDQVSDFQDALQNFEAYNNSVPERPILVIHFTTITQEMSWEAQLVGDILYQEWMKEILQKTLNIWIEGELQRDLEFTKNQNDYIVIIVKLYRSYDVSQIDLVVKNLDDMYMPIVEVYVDGKKIYFAFLTEDQKKVIQKLEPIAEVMPEIIQKASAIISASFCSYFILSLFNFWNLSLMYNFLIIDTVPNFARNINEMMIHLLYQKGSVSDWIVRAFNLQADTFDFSNLEGVSESIDKYRKGFSWFGLFGFSSIAIKNNLDTAFGCVFFIVKIFLLKVILKCVSKKIKKIIGIKKSFLPFFLLQIIAFTPFIMISSFLNIVVGFETNQGLRQKVIQVILLFICLASFVIWLIITHYQSVRDQYSQKKQLQQRLYRIKLKKKMKLIKYQINAVNSRIKSNKIQRNYVIFELILNISIPGLIWLDSPLAFLAINTIIIAARTIYFCRNIACLQLLDRIFGFIMVLVWIIHHFIYVLFYILKLLRAQEIGDSEMMSTIGVYCGIIIILTVVLGGCVQIIRFICELFVLIFLIIKRLIKNYYKNNIKAEELASRKKQKKNKAIKSSIFSPIQNKPYYANKNSQKDKQSKCFYTPTRINLTLIKARQKKITQRKTEKNRLQIIVKK